MAIFLALLVGVGLLMQLHENEKESKGEPLGVGFYVLKFFLVVVGVGLLVMIYVARKS
ncbi:hypothetical protein QCD83_25340 [Pseudomonas savastanoi pv. phaseolicola]|uniref:Uncharacterized protein n=1 Tax=Pseudomonas savastanoi pv. phaseolicola TaxID=319 RepID=A0ABD4BJ32_PSESH|nr:MULTISPECIES: hypothetical protein [Pseudomonas]KPB32779.1 Unknown protein sequence [Pseudomonas savastanoi pv. phaseolicola]KPB46979.1 Unknown protein sequence [Pseudomonas savastanoi pv. phaseolicola]KPB47916.1 Unknown protein sequence [Pseudomonas savastanoi pv. phaseolicola]KPB74674.1 Unknown protein sequence [Pseudomonas amygdali pv. mellea]KPY19185.1 Unknown protein sequence [Pseudomonas savastanoi pv. phaseolicola]